MSQKFRFNVNRLEFEKVTRPVWYFLLKGVKFFLVTVSLAAQEALNGSNPIGGALYFNSGRGRGQQIGNQHFF